MSCTASVRHTGNVAIIDLAGRIMRTSGCEVLRDAIKGEVERGRKNLLLNLSGVDYIDSSGVGELAGAFVTVAKLGGQVKLINTQPRVNSLLQVTNLYRIFVAFSDEGEALASFQ